jgi:NitT/TauT family transport system ATP-binding protein
LAESAEIVLGLRGLGKDFVTEHGVQRVLDDLTIDIYRGEFLSLLGTSGSGKTTLLRILSGLELPTRGEVHWEKEPSLAMVFQKALLLPWRTVLDNATFALECRGIKRADARERAVALLERVGLGDHLRHHPHEISAGMQQRVDLVRALLLRPDVLLMDEPFASLDLDTAASLQDLLLELWEDQRFTVLLVSHTLSEVARLSDRVAMLSGSPARITRIETVGLPRPRGQGEQGRIALVRSEMELATWYG